jgi:hypothetical protein
MEICSLVCYNALSKLRSKSNIQHAIAMDMPDLYVASLKFNATKAVNSRRYIRPGCNFTPNGVDAI